jgi:RNA polymerase sigma factor (sigma-70 family)
MAPVASTRRRRQRNAPCNARNAVLLAAYVEAPSIEGRNSVVSANLPLVWQVARIEARRSSVPFEDLVQVGSLGLIKAVESFDRSRGATLSCVAVPYIRGAMRQYLRDRCQPIKGSRNLRDLHQQGQNLQHQRLHHGLAPLLDIPLAAALGCSLERWQEAVALNRALQMGSLDQPAGAEGEEAGTLIDLVIDQHGGDAYGALAQTDQNELVQRCLSQLGAEQRQLLLGRVLHNRSWRELGAQLGLSGKVARHRCQDVLEELREQLTPMLAVG